MPSTEANMLSPQSRLSYAGRHRAGVFKIANRTILNSRRRE
jgi:hypothetical protein